jgi:putative pyrroloquinoline-quinone binding quinoprotein
MKIATPLLLICLTLVTQAQTPTDSLAQRGFAEVERIGEANARAFFVFTVGGRQYTVRHDGRGEITGPIFNKLRNFFLRLDGAARVDRLYSAEAGNDLLLAYQVTNGRSGWGYISRFDPSAPAFRWFASIPSMNVGPGLIEGNYVYVTGQDFLAKLDLQTGKYVWQQTDLGKEYGPVFAQFALPEINGATVVFPEAGARARTLEVDKATGRILKSASSH